MVHSSSGRSRSGSGSQVIIIHHAETYEAPSDPLRGPFGPYTRALWALIAAPSAIWKDRECEDAIKSLKVLQRNMQHCIILLYGFEGFNMRILWKIFSIEKEFLEKYYL